VTTDLDGRHELNRLDVLLRVRLSRLRVADACCLIGLRRRQVFRLLRGLKQDGAPSLLSKRRGKAGNHRLPVVVHALALSIVRERMPGRRSRLRSWRNCTAVRSRVRRYAVG
jgi:hypothetical protein